MEETTVPEGFRRVEEYGARPLLERISDSQLFELDGVTEYQIGVVFGAPEGEAK